MIAKRVPTNTEQAEEMGSTRLAEVGPSKLRMLLGSRKFWAALIGLGMIVFKTYKPDFPVSEEQLTSLVYLVIAYILGTAIEDSGARANASSKGNADAHAKVGG